MALRGDPLRERTLHAAKDVFMEMGFERASMDIIAMRASVSKRTLYAHFESKEKLYLDVVGLVRGLLLKRLKSPAEYSENATEAMTRFCGRFLEILLYAKTIQMCRVCIAEAERFPEGSGQYYETVFSEAHAQLSRYMQARLGLSAVKSSRAAEGLIAQIIYPRFNRALFGLDPLREHLEDEPSPDFDLKTIRAQVVELQRQ